MLYTNPRLATPRGRQWCRECRPDHLCTSHPFDPDFDRWSHEPYPWLRTPEMDALHEEAYDEDDARQEFLTVARCYEEGEIRPRIPMDSGEGDCMSEWEGFLCTLSKGHPGVHAAHSFSDEFPVATWPAEPETIECVCGGCAYPDQSGVFADEEEKDLEAELREAVLKYAAEVGLELDGKDFIVSITWEE